jgi:hypothetical protein
MTRLRDIITDAVDLSLNEQDAGTDVVTSDLTAAIERAIIDASGGEHHIVQVKGYSWTIAHPITERFETDHPGGLFACRYSTLVAEAEFEEDGTFRVWLDRNALLWEPVPHQG